MEMLAKMEQKGVVALRTTGNDSSLIFNDVREDEHTINRIAKFLQQQNEIKLRQFESVVHFANDDTRCKSRLILEYFDEQTTANCGICSYCVAKKRQPKSPVEMATAIIGLLRSGAYSSRDIEAMLGLTPQETIFAIDLLLGGGRIKITNYNEYALL